MKRLPTSFETTALSPLPLGEPPEPFPGIHSNGAQMSWISEPLYLLIGPCLSPNVSEETTWSTNLWGRTFLTWSTSARSPASTWPTPGLRTSVCLWSERSPSKTERFVHVVSRPRWRQTPTWSHLSVLFQELTEEGLPFLILFHINDDTESLEKFQQEVARQLISEKGPFPIYLLRSQTKHVHNVGFSFFSPRLNKLPARRLR